MASSLKNLTFNVVKTAMQKLGDLKVGVSYRRVHPGAYDPITDTTDDVVESYEFEAPRVGLDETEQAWIATDKKGAKLLIARSDLPVMPLITDYCMIEGERWEVVRLKRVPGDAVWIVIIQGT